MKDMKENIHLLLQKIGYEEHQWNICADLRVTAMLTGMQARYTKFYCL
jgi:hypothetical protein